MVFFVSFLQKPVENDSTQNAYNPTVWNPCADEDIPIFCGFVENENEITPNTTTKHEEDTSYWMECVDPNFNPHGKILESFESADDEKHE